MLGVNVDLMMRRKEMSIKNVNRVANAGYITAYMMLAVSKRLSSVAINVGSKSDFVSSFYFV